MKNEIIRLGKLEINLQELANFLVEAKKEGYTGDGKYISLPDGSKQFVFRKQGSPLYFTDNYKGYYQFAGSEKVDIEVHNSNYPKKDIIPIWQMNYFGKIHPELLGNEKFVKKIYDYLRERLLEVTPEKPFRGQLGSNKVDNLKYKDLSRNIDISNLTSMNLSEGDIKDFHGKERIYGRVYWGGPDFDVYSLKFHGGLIIPK